MQFLPEVISLSDLGLAGLVTLAVLMLFTGGLVTYREHKATLKLVEVLEERVRVKDAMLQTLTEANLELTKELTPTVTQILRALPTPRQERDEER